MKCKTCGKNAESEYCFRCKPRKALKNKKLLPSKWALSYKEELDDIYTRNLFFSTIWLERKHESEISGTYLGKEPLTVFFHHILPKEKYKMAKYDEENIILLTWEEHDQVELDETRYPEINKRREQLKIKYNL